MTGPFLTRMSVVEPAINLGLHKGAILDVYFAILIAGGQIGLPITLLTMFFNGKGSRRHPTLINVLVSWMLYAIVNLLLCVFSRLSFPTLQLTHLSLYAGEARSLQPKFDVCLIQASLIYGSTVKCVKLYSLVPPGQLTTSL